MDHAAGTDLHHQRDPTLSRPTTLAYSVTRRFLVTLAEIQDHLALFPGAAPEYPFGPDAQVWKVGGKMFALVSEDDDPLRITLKCDPDFALELRAQYPDNVTGGHHMNKKHWNTVTVDAGLPDFEVEDWIGHSYDLVVAGLPKEVRHALD